MAAPWSLPRFRIFTCRPQRRIHARACTKGIGRSRSMNMRAPRANDPDPPSRNEIGKIPLRIWAPPINSVVLDRKFVPVMVSAALAVRRFA